MSEMPASNRPDFLIGGDDSLDIPLLDGSTFQSLWEDISRHDDKLKDAEVVIKRISGITSSNEIVELNFYACSTIDFRDGKVGISGLTDDNARVYLIYCPNDNTEVTIAFPEQEVSDCTLDDSILQVA